MWSSKSESAAQGAAPFRSVGALFLTVVCPIVVMPRSAGGHVPKYITTAWRRTPSSMLAFVFAGHEGYIEGDIVMQLYPFMVIVLNLFALIFCAFLVVKA
ncbi:hypothetical protein FNF27_08235 [Cafeteria roenbergensis]|uniref:Uncharacterized protein n=1 Tax=Cafeteria roenbergensis TaxID=33653 RepID=A0A5A8D5F5_CAFRO|nr:hypothetical protein FNF27_08235 [Cafeteria roenbergensis]